MDGRVVFWPMDLVQQQGTLVGWKLSEKTFVLCSCLSVRLFVSSDSKAHLVPAAQTVTAADTTTESLLGKHGLQALGTFGKGESKETLWTFHHDVNGLPRCAHFKFKRDLCSFRQPL